MTNKPAISIIVPVYRAEKYIHRCIDSILSQTFADFELLLIDDGSPDKSGNICDEYAKREPRVRVFHKENGGVSSARQCGLDNISGKYLIHADPDDWVEPNMLEELYKKAVDDCADMVICDYFINGDRAQFYSHQTIPESNHYRILSELLLHNLHGSCCNKLVKAEVIKKYNLKFPQEMQLWEDLFFNCRLLLHDIKITYLNKAFYHYDNYSNDNSIARTHNSTNARDMIFFIDFFEKELPKELLPNLTACKVAVKESLFASMELSADEYYHIYPEITYNDYQKYTKSNCYSPRRLSISISYVRCYSASIYVYKILTSISEFLKKILIH